MLFGTLNDRRPFDVKVMNIGGEWDMPIQRLLEKSAFEPEHVKAMTTAFDEACHALGLANTDDPLREMVARKIIDIGMTGERDSRRIFERAIRELQNKQT